MRLWGTTAVVCAALAVGPTASAAAPLHPPDYNGDGYADLAVAAPFEQLLDELAAGEVNVLYGSATGLMGNPNAQRIDQQVAGFTREQSDRFGIGIGAGDFNGDGYSDLAVGAHGEETFAGAVNVLYGSPGKLTATTPQQIYQAHAGGTTEDGDFFGSALAVGDFDQDTYDDLVVGAWLEDITTSAAGDQDAAGVVNVLYGSPTGLNGGRPPREFSQAYGNGTVEAGDHFGFAVTSGDFDGDGRDDIAVGAPHEDATTIFDAGYVNVLYGSATGIGGGRAGRQLSQSQSAGTMETSDLFGFALAAGDFNKDGRDDLAAGAETESFSGADSAGAVNVVYGSATGLGDAGAQQLSQAQALGSPGEGDHFGAAVAAGDLDGDGYADLAAGAPNDDIDTRVGVGAANVAYGSPTGLNGGRSPRQLFQKQGGGVTENGDFFGTWMTAADYDADGMADLVVSAPFETLTAASGADMGQAGAVNVLYGSSAGVPGTRVRQFVQSEAAGVSEEQDQWGLRVR